MKLGQDDLARSGQAPSAAERGSAPPKIAAYDVSMLYEAAGGARVHALDRVTVEIQPGEFFCLVGPSGCGKSTLLFIMAGLIEPTGGRVVMNGAEVHGPSVNRGVVFQGDAVFPWMTVRQNVEYGPRQTGVPAPQRKAIVDRLLKLVGLEEFANAWPRQLSGGMKKRVDLARAYANDPEVLFMDEPFGALDVITKENLQIELQKEVGTLGKQKTIFFVTHDLEEALFLGDTVAVMSPRPGRIIASVNVPFPRPRDPHIKTTTEFQTLRRQLWDLLHGADL